MIELLAPAGDLEKLKFALLYGADAVFVGGENFSLRARASNFSISDIKNATDYAHPLGKKVYVTTNIIPHHEDMIGLLDYLKELESAGVDAIITASPYIIDCAINHTNLEVHLSTQQSSLNTRTVNYWTKKGVKRVVLGRELSIEEISDITSNTPADVEVFIHGGMCMSFSGRCSLSNNMTLRDANRGGCAHSCRWNYQVQDNNLKNTDITTPFSMSSKDLNALHHIEKLIAAKVSSLKIEGRMKSLHYIATVVGTYRMLIDEIKRTGRISDIRKYEKELDKAENRLTSHGYLDGTTNHFGQLYDQRSERPNQVFVGLVRAYDKSTKMATIEQRNYFSVGEKLETFSPNLELQYFQVNEMTSLDGEKQTVARHPRQLLKIYVPYEVVPNTLVRRAT